MATKKPKTAKKPVAKKTSAKPKATSTKAKTTAKSVAAKTTKKEKVTAKATVKEPKVEAVEKTVVMSEKTHPVKEFFARKGDKNENILTIFKDTRIIGAIIAEIIGTGLVTTIALTLGLFNPLYMIFGYIGITAAVFKLSGARDSMIFCGDAGSASGNEALSDKIIRDFADDISCDYIQMAHHGFGGLSEKFYEMASPKAAFFDSPEWLLSGENRLSAKEKEDFMRKMGCTIFSFYTAPNQIILK